MVSYLIGKRRSFLFDPRDLQNFPGAVSCFKYSKFPWQSKGFIHVEPADQLLCDDISATVSGNDHAEQCFVVKPVRSKERCHSINKGRQVGA